MLVLREPNGHLDFGCLFDVVVAVHVHVHAGGLVSGCDVRGNCANHVESEQIVHDVTVRDNLD